jgi:hypothetical protein
VLEERISYTKIISLAMLGDCLQIQFPVSCRNTIYKYRVIGPEAPPVKALIDPCRRIAHEIELRRTRERAQRSGGFVVAAVSERNRLHLFTMADLADGSLRRFACECNFTGLMLRQAVEQNVGIAPDHRVLLVRMTEKLFRWVTDDHMVRLIYIQNGMTVDTVRRRTQRLNPTRHHEEYRGSGRADLRVRGTAAHHAVHAVLASGAVQELEPPAVQAKVLGLSLANPIVAHSTVCDCRQSLCSHFTQQIRMRRISATHGWSSPIVFQQERT